MNGLTESICLSRINQCSTFIAVARRRFNRGDFLNLPRVGFDVEIFEFTACTQDVTLKTSDEFIIIINRSRKPAANGTQMPCGKRGIVFCKSMPGAIMPFERVRKRENLKPTDKIFWESPRVRGLRSQLSKPHCSLLTLRIMIASLYTCRNAGVVELVDARDSKSRSARSVGSIPTARTIPFSMIHLPHRTVGGSCQSGVWWTGGATPRLSEVAEYLLPCWPQQSRTGFGHRPRISFRETFVVFVM